MLTNYVMPGDGMFHQIYLASRESLRRVVARIAPPSEIEDIVQETYVRICQVKNPEAITSPKSFIFTTAKNLALDYQKQAGVRLVDSVDDWTEFERVINDASTDEVFQAKVASDEFAELCEAIRLLPVQCRKVFVLKKVYGYSQKEISHQLEISESTVEKHISSGTKRCMQFKRNRNKINEAKMNNSKEGFGGAYE
ncbi:RNA polymerase sigma factor [Thalassotalea fonticola]|uniref:RNA polymerase sigma factor n=1 Tax=Thalassotalea fonticola TaxID=3065649 RepID=A0ABZ0GK35_9GAMM|nr:RNA polymerase sigma factor [Colwelliaceae bacterium S1-1]